jgi:hypothetical protein
MELESDGGVGEFEHVQTGLLTPYESFLVGAFCDDSLRSGPGIHLQNILKAISGTLRQGFLRFVGCTDKRTYIRTHLRPRKRDSKGGFGSVRSVGADSLET